MRRAILTTMVLALGISLFTASGAGAVAKGGEFGDTCEGTRPGAPFAAAFETSRTGSSLPLAAPTSGVLTKWIAYMPALFPAEGVPPFTVRIVKVLGSGQVEVTAKGALEKLRPGPNEFETRLPIEAGEYLALGSNESGAIACSTTAEEEQTNVQVRGGGISFPLVQPGQRSAFESTELRVPVSGVIEPDVDGDGFGDLTQDACPQGADYQGPCPTISFAPSYTVGTKSVQVQVRSSAKARVAVSGLVPSASPGVNKAIAPGRLASFSLSIPHSLIAKLERLDPSRSLSARLVARVPDVTGSVSTDRLTVRLPGRRG
ncbi:MAG: hypothetical protein JST59_06655 [Actinobacteria bacterium]|nr:hypothetical protein [Actinomycetota bacterium]